MKISLIEHSFLIFHNERFALYSLPDVVLGEILEGKGFFFFPIQGIAQYVRPLKNYYTNIYAAVQQLS